LIIEIDGDTHAEPDQADYEKARTEWLENRGYQVLRIMNEDVHRHLDEELREIYLVCGERVAQLKQEGSRNSL
jgi:very-short-patch-repair endonuclease